MLGLSWLTDSWNVNQSPPGGLLRFELLRGPADEDNQPFYVKVYFESQSMDQQRTAAPLTASSPPDRTANCNIYGHFPRFLQLFLGPQFGG